MHPSLLFASRTLEEGLSKACTIHWNKTAVSQGEEFVTYETLLKEVIEFKIILNNAIGRKTVLIKTDNSLSNLFLLLGAILSDSIPLFYDPVWKSGELTKAVELNACSYIITDDNASVDESKVEVVQEFKDFKLMKIKKELDESVIDLLPQTSFCRFTSGSTGFSRCLQFTEQAFLSASYNWSLSAHYQHTDKVYCVATLNNGLAFNTSLLATFFSGAELILHKGTILPSSIRRTLEKKQPSVFVAFPFVYELILNSEKVTKDIFNVRLAISSAAPLTNEINESFQQKFAVKICNYYGLAEVGPCTFNEGDLHSVGYPLKNVEIKIDENEQVLLRTSSSALAFLDRSGEKFEKSFTEDYFFITKDLGEITTEGKLILKGRVGRMINIQGRKIDPVEIEKLIQAQPGITQVLVRAVQQNERMILTAYVESQSSTKEQILKICASNLAPYKIPQQVHIMERFPRSSTGKIAITNLETNVI